MLLLTPANEPLVDNVATCRVLYEQGHTIILQTERGMAEHGGNTAAATAAIAAPTLAALAKYRIPYHELHFGKPVADFYVDDRAVSSMADLPKEIGHYANSAYKATPAAPSTAADAVPLQPAPRGAPWSLVLLATIAGAGCGFAFASLKK